MRVNGISLSEWSDKQFAVHAKWSQLSQFSVIHCHCVLVRYDIYQSVRASSSVISKYDLPPPNRYHEFFRAVRTADFLPLSKHCSIFSGCVRDHFIETIMTTLPRLLEKHRQTSGDAQSCSLHDSDSSCTQTNHP